MQFYCYEPNEMIENQLFFSSIDDFIRELI